MNSIYDKIASKKQNWNRIGGRIASGMIRIPQLNEHVSKIILDD